MQPGQFNPKGEDWIGRRFAELEREIRELKAANIFGLTGITPKDGGTDFDGYVNVNGEMNVTGTLNLPAGIIGNEALAQPVTAQVAYASATSLALPALEEYVTIVTATVPVPAGFTRALVMAQADLSIVNSTALTNQASLKVKIGGVGSGALNSVDISAGERGYVGSAFSRLMTGVSGSFAITSEAAGSRGPWSDDGSGEASISASILFMR